MTARPEDCAAPWLDALRVLEETGLEPHFVERCVLEAVAAELASPRDLRRASRLRADCPVEGRTTEDYLPRWVEIDGCGQALVGIQFRGPGPRKPVLEVLQRSFRVDRAGTLSELQRCLRGQFADFRPSEALVFLTRAEEAACGQGAPGRPDERLIGARVHFLRQRAPPPRTRRLRLVRTHDLEWFEVYRAAYESFHGRAPEALREAVRVETRETLSRFIACGAVFEVLVDDAWAGLVAVLRQALSGLPGFLVVEEVLVEALRGQRLAPAVQDEMIRQLDASPLDCLFGKIHPLNTPSLRTAMGLGRLDLGGFRALSLT
jgi:hypothetical protein